MQLTKDEIDALLPEPAATNQPCIHTTTDRWAMQLVAHANWPVGTTFFTRDQLTAFAAAVIAEHTAKVLEDVEPVAWLDTVIDWTATGQPITRRICIQAQCGDWALSYIESALRETASTVAALKARVAELEKDAARLEFVCNSPNRMVERESGLWRVYEDVAPADHPTAVWQGMTPRWHVTPREAIDAAITAALTKGQP